MRRSAVQAGTGSVGTTRPQVLLLTRSPIVSFNFETFYADCIRDGELYCVSIITFEVYFCLIEFSSTITFISFCYCVLGSMTLLQLL